MDNIVFSNQEIKLLMQFSSKIEKAVNNYIKNNTFYDLDNLYIDIIRQKNFIKDLSIMLSEDGFDLIDIETNKIATSSKLEKLNNSFDNLYILADLIQEELYTNEELKEIWELNYAY